MSSLNKWRLAGVTASLPHALFMVGAIWLSPRLTIEMIVRMNGIEEAVPILYSDHTRGILGIFAFFYFLVGVFGTMKDVNHYMSKFPRPFDE